MKKYGASLNAVVGMTDRIKHVSRQNLNTHDYMYVKTVNSLYTVKKIEESLYEVSGGWFDRKGLSPCRTKIRGCTWGGSIIHINMIAACGFCLEFGNNVITSPVELIMVVQAHVLN